MAASHALLLTHRTVRVDTYRGAGNLPGKNGGVSEGMGETEIGRRFAARDISSLGV